MLSAPHSERNASVSNKHLQIENSSNAMRQPIGNRHKLSDDEPVTPRLGPQSSIRGFLSERSKVPTIHSRKSFFDTSFVDDNREILDNHQVKFISTISRYTVLSFVAFATTIMGSASGICYCKVFLVFNVFACISDSFS